MNYGSSTVMDLYVPTKVLASPPIVVALHYCGGTAASAHSWFKSYADKYGFTVIAPTAGGNCFDATPARSGERANIINMVKYVTTQNNADTKRIFAAGASSGACMTQALLAAYPDTFAAGSSLAAVPAGAWTGGNAYGWTTPASTTAQQWGDKVRQADPGFSGTRPRIQLWQGMGDTTLTYAQNYPAEVAQWTNVFGVSNGTMTSVQPTGAQDTWARTTYKDASGTVVVEANSGPMNVPHDLTGRGLWGDVVRFFGLDMTSSGGTGGAGGVGGSAGTGAGGTGASGAGAGGAGASGAGAGSGGVNSGGASGAGTSGGSSSGGAGTGAGGFAGTGFAGGSGSGVAGSGVAGSGVAGNGTGGSYAGGANGGATGVSGSPGSAGGIATSGSAGDLSGTAGDSSEPGSSPADKPGCSCRVGSARSHDGWLGLLAAGGLFGALRRSRRRQG